MKHMLKYRWVLLVIWILATGLFVMNQPNFKEILNTKGETIVPKTEASQVAAELLKEMGKSSGDTMLIVFNSDKRLTNSEKESIRSGVENLKAKEKALGILRVVDPFSMPEIEEQLVSKDGTCIVIPVSYDKGTKDNRDVVNGFKDAVKDVKVTHYLTGGLAINSDYVSDVSKSVEKSSIITVIFILAVLVIMFRSVVTPLVSLMAVVVSYFASMGIIGILVNRFNFPVNNFTQMFVILVLFGIGTDYHILLFNRFKEEMAKGITLDEAIINSMKTAGKTIIYSGLTVFMGFASLTFVKFPIYQSANAVAIGIAVLLIEMLTLTPILMRLIGKYLFWPSKHTSGHKENRFWGKMANLSVKYPVQSLVIVAAVIVPIIVFSPVKLSFDNIKDLRAESPSVVGFNIVADKFGAGKVMQTSVVIKSDHPMDTDEALLAIDNLTEKLSGVKGVAEVDGPTRPLGKKIAKLYTGDQTATVADGLDKANDGIDKVRDGLDQMSESLTTPDFSQVKSLSDGSRQITQGLGAVNEGLVKINGGMDQSASGAAQLTDAVKQLKTGVLQVNAGLKTINGKLDEIQKGYVQLGEGYKQMPASIAQMKQLTAGMQGVVSKLEAKWPNDTDVATLKGMIVQLNTALDGLSGGISKANGNMEQLNSGLAQLNAGLAGAVQNTSETSQMVQGINEIEKGTAALASGLKQGSGGQKQVIDSIAKLKSGSAKVTSGQEALNKNLNQMGSGMAQLKDGINKSSDGLVTISDGVDKSTKFLGEISTGGSFYIPKDAKDSEDIHKMLDGYMSDDRKIAKLTITLDYEPYEDASIDLIKVLNNTLTSTIKGTVLSDAQVGLAGSTAISNDLREIATHDITFTQVIVLLAIFILLLIVIRSFWTSVFIIGALVVTFYTSLHATAYISKYLFASAQNGLSWNVPFFAFVMIAALGVDYSIFLMERYREHDDMSAHEAITIAARHIGGVVMSAAFILAGTFMTMYPSQIVVLMELAICVVIGLFLLAFLLLPAALPALITLTERISAKESVRGKDLHL